MDEESKLCTDYCASFAAGNFGKSRVGVDCRIASKTISNLMTLFFSIIHTFL